MYEKFIENFRQILKHVFMVCSTLAFLPLVTAGAQLVWLSSTYFSLVSNNSTINPLVKPVTIGEISLIGGLPVLFGLIGTLALTTLSDKIGRKLFLLLAALGMFVFNLALAVSSSAVMLISFKCCFYVFFTSYYVILQVYLSEICERRNKAKYMCVMGLCLPLGNIYGFLFGPMVDYRTFTHILGLPSLPFLGFFCFAPESPVYYLLIGKKEEGLNVLTKLRVNKDLGELDKELTGLNEPLTTGSPKDRTILHLLKTKESREATAIALLLGIGTHACGMFTIMGFLGPILVESGTQFSENAMTVPVAIVQVVSLLVTTQFVVKIGRKKLLLCSSIGCGITCFLWGFFYYLKKINSPIVHSISLLPLIAVIIYTIMFSIGLGSIPATVISEIFLPQMVPAAASLMIAAAEITVFLMLSSYLLISQNIGIDLCIWIFSVNCFIMAYLLYRFLPETKGKSVLQVQEELKQF